MNLNLCLNEETFETLESKITHFEEIFSEKKMKFFQEFEVLELLGEVSTLIYFHNKKIYY